MGIYNPKMFVDRDRELRGFCKMLKPETQEAIMLIRADEWMGKSWLIRHMSTQCQKETGEALIVDIDFKNPRERHEVQDTLSLMRLIRDKLDHPRYFNKFNESINSFSEGELSTRSRALLRLADMIAEYFSLAELKRLSRLMDTKYENLGGEQSPLSEKAYQLVDLMRRTQHLDDLFDKLEEERPRVDWSQERDAVRSELADVLDEETTEGGPLVKDRKAPLLLDGDKGRSLAEREISKAFFDCLQKLADKVHPIIFLLDGCEEVPDEAREWIRVQLIDRLGTGKLDDVIIIFGGRALPHISDLNIGNLIVETELDAFDEERVRQFFEVHGVQVPAEEIHTHTKGSGGKPGMLAHMVDNLRAESDSKDPFFDE